MQIRNELRSSYIQIEGNIYNSNPDGYWSNLDKVENERLISVLSYMNTEQAIKKYHGWLFEVIFSKKRAVGLELLDLNGTETCIDCGCMWGALTIPLAKRCSYVLGVDQTLDSLRFLSVRAKEENLDNIDLLHEDLKHIKLFDHKFDVAILNGVLEWIPERGDIELKSYWGKKCLNKKQYSIYKSPISQQKHFLNLIRKNLKDEGKLYLAIENRYDYKMFVGFNDPHIGLPFVSILPRKLSNYICQLRLNRPYVNWLYSFIKIKKILNDSGFSKIGLYGCYPDYRFPERIFPFDLGIHNFRSTIQAKKMTSKIRKKIELILFRYLKLKFFFPSIIAIAQK